MRVSGLIPQLKSIRKEPNVNVSVAGRFLHARAGTKRGQIEPLQAIIQTADLVNRLRQGGIAISKKAVVLNQQRGFSQKKVERQLCYILRGAPDEQRNV